MVLQIGQIVFMVLNLLVGFYFAAGLLALKSPENPLHFIPFVFMFLISVACLSAAVTFLIDISKKRISNHLLRNGLLIPFGLILIFATLNITAQLVGIDLYPPTWIIQPDDFGVN